MGTEQRLLAVPRTRREVLRLLALGGAGLGFVACAPSSAPSGASAPTAAPAAASQATAAPAQASGAGAGAIPATWDDLVAAAQSEGTVVVGAAGDPDTRAQLPAAFTKRFGINVDYLGELTAPQAARIEAERAAGQYSVDVSVSGSDTVYGTFYPKGWLDPIKPILMAPDVTDPSVWTKGQPWFGDPNGDTVLRLFSTVQQLIAINTADVPVSAVPTADSLLDPQWQGKICAYNPSVNGTGLAIGAALYISKGQDYVTQLYNGQKVTLSQDFQQVATWVAQGDYPIALAATYNYLKPFQDSGIPIQQPELSDAPSVVSGGICLVCLFNNAPHPNAGRLFANWIAGKEGLTLYAQTNKQVPVRTDIDLSFLPQQMVPVPGVNYIDAYDYNFLVNQRLPIRDFYAGILNTGG